MTDERVIAVVVSYNRREDLRACVARIQSQTHPVAQILVVDNGSTDGALEMLRDQFPDVRVHALDTNRGGAGGFAAGVRLATAGDWDFMWLMDDDAWPEQECLRVLLEVARAHPGTGFISPTVADTVTGAVVGSHAASSDRADGDDAAVVTWGSFVGPLISVDAARSTHLPLEAFFLWNDDVEYTGRIARLSGGRTARKAIIRHPTAASNRDLQGRVRMYARNIVWLLRARGGLPIGDKYRFAIRFIGLLRGQYSRSTNRMALARLTMIGLLDGIRAKPLMENSNQGSR